ncbi:unnamed protein product, partial [Didymodactylos carnosus]
MTLSETEVQQILSVTTKSAPSHANQQWKLPEDKEKSLIGTIAIANNILNGTLVEKMSIEESELLKSWLVYFSNYKLDKDDQQKIVLKHLNSFLTSHSYFCSTNKQELSIVDQFIYYSIRNIITQLPFQDKAQFLNLCRWFNQ